MSINNNECRDTNASLIIVNMPSSNGKNSEKCFNEQKQLEIIR